MGEAETGTATQDLMEKMRELRDAYLEVWSKHLIETVNSDSYAEASGAMLNSYLNAAAPFKEPLTEAMLRTLEQLHMPSSADFASLAGRFTNIELQIDNLDAKLDRIEKILAGSPPGQARRRPTAARTRVAVSSFARKPASKRPPAAQAVRGKARKK